MLTLMLNVGYEPIRLIRWQRAVTMCFLGKAEVLEEYTSPLRSTFLEMNKPAVIRLLEFHKYREKVRLTREHIYARDQYTCQYCGQRFSFNQLTLDHVQPQSRGGGFRWANLVACCEPCNGKKGARTPEEAEMPLLRKPKTPTWMPSVLVKAIKTKTVPKQWAAWIGWIDT